MRQAFGGFQYFMLIDVDGNWKKDAACKSLDPELFFDKYEEDPDLAKAVDQICLGCPVISRCFEVGTSLNNYGVWGGVYLVEGEPDKSRNLHKTQTVWTEIMELINE
jgi:hypothetical protein